uniref:Predicted protein n=1 Tax=Physcomitrium patens TaxID=3218 RepID=A9U5F6_PHYPA|nr:hypothetical protein PHYPA_027479 [Physcomitrium patens]
MAAILPFAFNITNESVTEVDDRTAAAIHNKVVTTLDLIEPIQNADEDVKTVELERAVGGGRKRGWEAGGATNGDRANLEVKTYGRLIRSSLNKAGRGMGDKLDLD